MSEPASPSRSADLSAARARNGELAHQLRAAAIEGDEARICGLIGELLRCKGMSRGQRIALQQKALLHLVHSLRCAALNDDLTGLYNRRGFVQVGTRLLDLAVRDAQPAYLAYFGITELKRVSESLGRQAAEIVVRHTGNLLRDLFPSYGVYDVLGRLGSAEFAALTTSEQHASPQAITPRLRRVQQRGWDVAVPGLRFGMAHFNPCRPVGIDELLDDARRAMHEPTNSQIALPELAPIPA